MWCDRPLLFLESKLAFVCNVAVDTPAAFAGDPVHVPAVLAEERKESAVKSVKSLRPDSPLYAEDRELRLI